jgi:hypothetical protein
VVNYLLQTNDTAKCSRQDTRREYMHHWYLDRLLIQLGMWFSCHFYAPHNSCYIWWTHWITLFILVMKFKCFVFFLFYFLYVCRYR